MATQDSKSEQTPAMTQEQAEAKVTDLQKQLDEANAKTADAEARALAIEEEIARTSAAAPSPISNSGTITAPPIESPTGPTGATGPTGVTGRTGS
jgi:hypothetical protein